MILFSLATGYFITALVQALTAVIRAAVSVGGDTRFNAFGMSKIVLEEDYEVNEDERPNRTRLQFLGKWPTNIKDIFDRNSEASASGLGFVLPLVPVVSVGLISGVTILVAALAAALLGIICGYVIWKSDKPVRKVWKIFGIMSFIFTAVSFSAALVFFVLGCIFPAFVIT